MMNSTVGARNKEGTLLNKLAIALNKRFPGGYRAGCGGYSEVKAFVQGYCACYVDVGGEVPTIIPYIISRGTLHELFVED